jgi:hypothetical protein
MSADTRPMGLYFEGDSGEYSLMRDGRFLGLVSREGRQWRYLAKGAAPARFAEMKGPFATRSSAADALVQEVARAH